MLIITDPPNADVIIDGKKSGHTPRKIYLKPGPYLVKVYIPGYKQEQHAVTVTPSAGASLHLKLKPLSGKPVPIKVDSLPSGAELLINGEVIGNTPADLILKPGRYQIKVTLDGYEAHKQSLDVDAEGENALSVKLERQKGKLLVKSSPSGALVTIDGKKRGVTPLGPVALPIGSHLVQVAKSAHESTEQTVNIEAGEVAKLDLKLRITAAERARRKKLKSAYQRKAKIFQEHAASVEQQRKNKMLMGTISSCVGGAALIAAGVLYGVGVTQGNEAHDTYSATTDQSIMDENREIVEASRTKLIAGHVLAGVGLAGVAVGVWQLLTRPEMPAPPRMPRLSLSRFGLAPTQGGLVLSLGGSL